MKSTPLYEREQAAGAEFEVFSGCEIPRNFGDAAREYEAIRQSAAIFDLSYRSRLELSGPDRITLLQSICSNDIKALSPGAGVEAAFLTTMGKVVGYGRFYVTEEAVLIDLDSEAQAATEGYLNKYLKISNAQLRDLSETQGQFTVQGPRARDVVEAATGAQLGHLALHGFVNHGIGDYAAIIARVSHTGEDGFDIIATSEALPEIWDLILRAGRELGVKPAGFAAFNIARIEAGIPLFGVDYNETNILTEANLESAVSYTKGCYVGQEIIARLRYRGHVAKRVTLLQVEAETLPLAGDKVFRETREVGAITSAVFSPLLKKPLAMGIVRYEPSQPGTELSIDSSDYRLPALVIAPPRATANPAEARS